LKPITRFNQALLLATEVHSGQIRKGTENTTGLAVPYITHPVAVSALVVRYGGDEDQAISGLLHDVLEDGGAQWAEPIQKAFGDRVLSMVQACTDGVPDATGKKPDWKPRKQAYLEHLANSSGDALLVSACDKLHNLTCIVADLRELGDAVFERFTSSKEQTIWYYTELAGVLAGRVPERLDRAIQAELRYLCASV
jgi:(p)ppGpp synthase/HD superfamily hydrolase